MNAPRQEAAAPKALPTASGITPPEGMALIAGGSFTMGSSSEDALAALARCEQFVGRGRCPEELFMREVAVAGVRMVGAFYIDLHETTCEEFSG